MLMKTIFSSVRFSSARTVVVSHQHLFCTDSPTTAIPEVPVKKSLPEKFLSDRKVIFETYPPNKTPYKPRQAWVETLSSTLWNPTNSHIVELHPEVWSVRPRLDILYDNVEWQEQYKTVEFNFVRNAHELPLKGKKKPWPTKGMGRARHATHRSPLWLQGGKSHGPRGPTTFYRMLPIDLRIAGLTHALSAKFSQDDVRIVENLDIPTDDPKFIEDMINEKNLGISVLFVDENDIFPRNITAATTEILHTNLMPVYGLNVMSMLRHKSLILTLDALNALEERILFAMHRSDRIYKTIQSSTFGKDRL